MIERKNSIALKSLTAVTLVIMITLNALANILPINGMGTGQISDLYPNLFAPAGMTFAIWGLIYILLTLFVLYQFGLFQTDKKTFKQELNEKIGILFSISSLANAAWILAWHYRVIPVSMILMLVILVCLILIILEIKKAELSPREKIMIRLPFSVYFGWITVATIANATTLLVSLRWDGFGISEELWTAAIILVGLIIGVATIVRNKDLAYGLVLIWAYGGILLKHTADSGFAGQYSMVIYTVIGAIVVLILTEGYILFSRKTYYK